MITQPLLLPDFIIIGAMKSGTTTLYRYLAEHPEINMSRDKETDFFVAEKNWGQGLEWYSSQFTSEQCTRGEASPNYTKCRDFPGVPERIAKTCPDTRLIFIVRDPVKRAKSQFQHSFIMGELDPDMADFHNSHEYHHIMDASHYARQLEAYLIHFKLEQILILDFEEMIKDPQAALNEITAHIGVSPLQIQNNGAQNDSTELSRVPAPILRFAQSPRGRKLAGLISRKTRNKIRGALAFGKARQPTEFSSELLENMRQELASDTARFRKMTGQPFPHWTL
ncbi:MAG: sulfotransferase family protein [Hyphomonas sp.]